MKANKFLGQNFLVDKTKIKEIVDSLNINNELVLEVGPGQGAITFPILEKAKKLYAIETDIRMVELLKESKSNNLEVINDDVINFDFKTFFKQNKIKEIYFVSNLPYYIASPIIFEIIKHKEFNNISIMLQKEMADRLTAKNNTRSFGRLTVAINTYFEVVNKISVPAGCFSPKPKVDSTFLTLKRKSKGKVEQEYLSFVKQAFALKRKTLLNSLKGNKKYYEAAKKWIEKNNKSETIRAEQITIDEFITIYKSIKN